MGLGIAPKVYQASFALNNQAVRLLPQKNHLLVLTFHRIGNRQQLWPDPAGLAESSVEQFEAQMCWVRDNCHVVDLAEARRLLVSGTPYPSRTALVTFDDAYREDIYRALPILERYGIRPTVFLPTEYMGTKQRFWWDRIGACVNLSRKTHLRAELLGGLDLSLASQEERDEAIYHLQGLVRNLPMSERPAFFSGLEEALEVEGSAESDHVRVLSWDEVRELRSSLDFGAHTLWHPRLSRLSRDEIRKELAESKAAVERELGGPCPSFAIPYGGTADYTPDTVEIAAEVGFEMIFSLEDTLRGPQWTGSMALVDRMNLDASMGVTGLAAKVTWPWVFIPDWLGKLQQSVSRLRNFFPG